MVDTGSVTHNVIPRICCNNCNPCTLDPLDTNSRRIIQITTPSRTHPPTSPSSLSLRLYTAAFAYPPSTNPPHRVLFPLFRSERVCHSNSNLKQSRSDRRRGFFVVSTLSSRNRFPIIFLLRRSRPDDESVADGSSCRRERENRRV